MGKPLTTEQETELLRQVTREAHEALKDLRAAIREARELANGMVSEFERIHAGEIKQLSNFLAEESNRQAANINASVAVARREIMKQLTVAALRFDETDGQLYISWEGGHFDDRQAPPYPEVAPKGPPQ